MTITERGCCAGRTGREEEKLKVSTTLYSSCLGRGLFYKPVLQLPSKHFLTAVDAAPLLLRLGELFPSLLTPQPEKLVHQLRGGAARDQKAATRGHSAGFRTETIERTADTFSPEKQQC